MKNNSKRQEAEVHHEVGDRLKARTLEGDAEGEVTRVSGRGYWMHLDNSEEGIETFVKAENVAEDVERRGAKQEEVGEMEKNKKSERKVAERGKPEVEKKPKAPASASVQKKLPEGAVDPKTCRHDIVERKLDGHGAYEMKGRCYECGTPLVFGEKGEKKLTPP